MTRTALGEVARRPTIPLVTAGFLAAATMLAVFSLGYRSTLQTSAHDQAAFTVPYDVRLTLGPDLVRPSKLEPASGWSALAPSATATEVLRRGVSVRSDLAINDTVTVVGIDPSTLPLLRGWRHDFGPSPSSMAQAIASPSPLPTLGTAIPADATNMRIAGDGDLSTTETRVIIARADGTWHEANAKLAADDPGRLDVRLEPGDAGGRVIGFRIGQPGDQAKLVEHHIGEGATTVAYFTASVGITGVETSAADGAEGSWTPLPIDWSSLVSDGAEISYPNGALHVDLALQGTSAIIEPAAPPQLAQIPAIVDPTTAAAAENGLVTVEVPGQSDVTLRVAGVATRFPGAPDRFAIIDRSLGQLAFDLLDPAFGTANEVWIGVDHADDARLASALSQPPFDGLIMQQRSAIQARLLSDPLSRFTLGLFGVAALIAAILAIAAIYLSTANDASDQAPLHRALAAEGVPPPSLSRMVRAASAAIAVVAIVVGSLGALLLLRVVTRVIAVTATSTIPVPPLITDLFGVQLVIAVVAIAIPCLLAATIAARTAQRTARGDLLREFG